MTLRIIAAALLLGALPAAGAAATFSGWGVNASAGSASNCPIGCTSAGGGEFTGGSDGGEFQTFAFFEDVNFGDSRAEAGFSGPGFLPELKAEAQSDVGRRGNSAAFGVQGYTWTGTSDVDISFSYALSGSVEDNPSGYVFNRIDASVAVAQGAGAGPDIPWVPSFDTLVFEDIPLSGGDVVGNDSLFLTPSIENLTGQIDFTVGAGESFFIVMALSTIAQNGEADAFSTLSGELLSPTGGPISGLTVASASGGGGVGVIPLPAAGWLSLTTLVALAGLRRRATA